MKPVKINVPKQVYIQVWNQVSMEIMDQIDGKIEKEDLYQVWNQVADQVEDQVWDCVGNEVLIVTDYNL